MNNWIPEKQLPELTDGKSKDVWIAEPKEENGKRISGFDIFKARFQIFGTGRFGSWTNGKQVFVPSYWMDIENENEEPQQPKP